MSSGSSCRNNQDSRASDRSYTRVSCSFVDQGPVVQN